jgi:hypothetical protein
MVRRGARGGEVCHAAARRRKICVRRAASGMNALTEEERAEIEARIRALEIEHRDLDDVILRLSEHPAQDQLQLRRLKKRKLFLKDSIERLRARLVPDIPA